MVFLIIYLVVINIVAFAAMGIDKQKAIKGEWRIPEKRLFAYVILGGGIGGCLGMSIFRHKTKHIQFKIFFPLITVVEYAVILFVMLRNPEALYTLLPILFSKEG
jgi:uncharacterized membrane protein YsdA (DUF1294 family)